MKFVPIQQAAQTDPRVKSLLEKITSGSVVACAPSADMYQPWSEDEKRRLDQALNLVIKPR